MTQSSSSSAASQTYEPGRAVGIIVRDSTREKGYVFIRDANNVEYFAHITAFEPAELFQEIVVGDPVTFRITSTTKGQRAWEIRRPTSEEAVEAAQQIEDLLAAKRASAHRAGEMRGHRER